MADLPVLQCHLCLDMVEMGIIDPEEARPAVVVKPTTGSLCDWHRTHTAFGTLKVPPGQGRERYREPLYENGFLARERVLEHIVTTVHDLAGTVEQMREGLIEMAEADYGDCVHPPGSKITDDRCIRCIARRFLTVLDSSVGWEQINVGLPK